jgi:hypothetical protein
MLLNRWQGMPALWPVTGRWCDLHAAPHSYTWRMGEPHTCSTTRIDKEGREIHVLLANMRSAYPVRCAGLQPIAISTGGDIQTKNSRTTSLYALTGMRKKPANGKTTPFIPCDAIRMTRAVDLCPLRQTATPHCLACTAACNSRVFTAGNSNDSKDLQPHGVF